jgi:sortase (surface protein transpeptidase)
MAGLLRVFLIFALVYLVLKILFRYIFPVLLTKFISRKMKEMTKKAQNFQNQQQNRKNVGEVTIEYEPSAKKQFSKDSGEYIDFEEIKD